MDKVFEEIKRKTPLEMFKEIKDLEVADSPLMTVEDCLPFMCEKVEQDLINKQDLEKFTKLIIDKRVDMNLLAIRHNVESYNNDYYDSHYSYDVGAYLLFEKEFTFIKKVIAIYGKSI